MTQKVRTVAEWSVSNDKMTEPEWLAWTDAQAMLMGLGEIKDCRVRVPAFVATFAESGRVRQLLSAELRPVFDAYLRWVWNAEPHPATLYPQFAKRPGQQIDGPSVVSEAILTLVVYPSWNAAGGLGLAEAYNSAEVNPFEQAPTPDTAEWLHSQSHRLRDVVGNPFRPVAFAPEWLTSDVLALARQMYESRDFGAMPILADALQDAGCDNTDVLNHCRGDGPHVRGCWVVDLVLGKS